MRLKESAGDDYVPEVAAYQAVTISDALYGNDVMSAFELAKGFTKPVNAKSADSTVPQDFIDARDKLPARRRLALGLRSKTTAEVPVATGETVKTVFKRKILTSAASGVNPKRYLQPLTVPALSPYLAATADSSLPRLRMLPRHLPDIIRSSGSSAS